VLTDSKNSTKSGKYKEMLGSYDPRKDNTTQINGERVKHWLSVGAEASGTVHNLLLTHKVIEGKKINVLPKKTVPKKEEVTTEAPSQSVNSEKETSDTSKAEEKKVEEAPQSSELASEVKPQEIPE